MKKLILLSAAALCTHFAHAQSDAEQKAWMAYATPGAMQQKLAEANGNWTEETSVWMQPDQPPMKSKGTAKNEMILGGRYQQSTHNGDFMGMPFQGISITGYDNARKIWVSSWIDNMGTGIMNSEGVMLPDGKSIEFRGKMTDAMTGKLTEFREVFTFVDKDHQKMEMYTTQGVTETKTMEILFTRAK
jgi:hypothetical protein